MNTNAFILTFLLIFLSANTVKSHIFLICPNQNYSKKIEKSINLDTPCHETNTKKNNYYPCLKCDCNLNQQLVTNSVELFQSLPLSSIFGELILGTYSYPYYKIIPPPKVFFKNYG